MSKPLGFFLSYSKGLPVGKQLVKPFPLAWLGCSGRRVGQTDDGIWQNRYRHSCFPLAVQPGASLGRFNSRRWLWTPCPCWLGKCIPVMKTRINIFISRPRSPCQTRQADQIFFTLPNPRHAAPPQIQPHLTVMMSAQPETPPSEAVDQPPSGMSKTQWKKLKRAQEQAKTEERETTVDEGDANDSKNPFIATVQKRARNARKKLVRFFLVRIVTNCADED